MKIEDVCPLCNWPTKHINGKCMVCEERKHKIHTMLGILGESLSDVCTYSDEAASMIIEKMIDKGLL